MKIELEVEDDVHSTASSVGNLLCIHTFSSTTQTLCLHGSRSISKAISPQLQEKKPESLSAAAAT